MPHILLMGGGHCAKAIAEGCVPLDWKYSFKILEQNMPFLKGQQKPTILRMISLHKKIKNHYLVSATYFFWAMIGKRMKNVSQDYFLQVILEGWESLVPNQRESLHQCCIAWNQPRSPRWSQLSYWLGDRSRESGRDCNSSSSRNIGCTQRYQSLKMCSLQCLNSSTDSMMSSSARCASFFLYLGKSGYHRLTNSLIVETSTIL